MIVKTRLTPAERQSVSHPVIAFTAVALQPVRRYADAAVEFGNRSWLALAGNGGGTSGGNVTANGGSGGNLR